MECELWEGAARREDLHLAPLSRALQFRPVLGLFTSEPINLYDFLSSPENEEGWRWWFGGPLTTTGRDRPFEVPTAREALD